ncbi:surface lipoprotein assembly modifier [Ruegeria sp. Ofav3-42]|uniref:surface lipoprotein assembly modifier n=1 Tax=Ruegeria sp. Ofav3-42 TaxID=2917759 RepID=UPI001EF64BAF|nr:surface lipoprotein assembly modifier [Ruegeria sp. Ofav3-42]MCG7518566.1 surface lipoprotein assembly modifier [Ruegeria sp. Ofav3-42]
MLLVSVQSKELRISTNSIVFQKLALVLLRTLFLIAAIATITLNVTSASAQTQISQGSASIAEAEQIERVFLSGLQDLQRGNTDAAITKFSSILADNPNLVRVRLELGLAYYLSRQWNRARNEFFTALSGDLPDSVRNKVLGLIREIDARRGFDWDFSIGVANVGDQREYDTDEIILDFPNGNLPFSFNREKSSEIGLRATGSANFRKPVKWKLLGADTVAFASLSFDVTEARASSYDDYILGTRFGLRMLTQNTTASIGPLVSTRLLGGNVFENRIALQAAIERRNQRGASFFAILSGTRLHNPTSSSLDGDEIGAEIGVRRSLGGKGLVGASFLFQDKSVEDNLENFIRQRFTIFGQVDVQGGFTLRPSVFAEQKRFKTPSALFTGNPNEKTFGGSLRVEKNDLFFGNGFSPFLLLAYRRTKSGIDAFSFKESEFELGIERRF